MQAKVAVLAVQFIRVKSFFFLSKFVGQKNPLVRARIACFVSLAPEREKNITANSKGCENDVVIHAAFSTFEHYAKHAMCATVVGRWLERPTERQFIACLLWKTENVP